MINTVGNVALKLLKSLMWLVLSSSLLLGGCGGSPAAPATLNSGWATFEAPPQGTFECGYIVDSLVFGRPREITLSPDGSFEFYPQEEMADRERGQWSYEAEVHQIGFAGDTSLDYAYYDYGARQLIVYMKPASNGQISILHCVSLGGEPAVQP